MSVSSVGSSNSSVNLQQLLKQVSQGKTSPAATTKDADHDGDIDGAGANESSESGRLNVTA